jgi:hypothetical protein
MTKFDLIVHFFNMKRESTSKIFYKREEKKTWKEKVLPKYFIKEKKKKTWKTSQ